MTKLQGNMVCAKCKRTSEYVNHQEVCIAVLKKAGWVSNASSSRCLKGGWHKWTPAPQAEATLGVECPQMRTTLLVGGAGDQDAER